jgi:hypothetical protein
LCVTDEWAHDIGQPLSEIGADAFTRAHAATSYRQAADYFDDGKDVKITKDMLDLAKHIVEQKSGHFDPTVRGRASRAAIHAASAIALIVAS